MISFRSVFDKEARRKPLAFAADALLWGLNRLSPATNTIQISYRNQAKPQKDVPRAHNIDIMTREASAAQAASSLSANRKL